MNLIVDWNILIKEWMNSESPGGFGYFLAEHPESVNTMESFGVTIVSEIPGGRKTFQEVFKWFVRRIESMCATEPYERVLILRGCTAEQDISLFRRSRVFASSLATPDTFSLTRFAQHLGSSFIVSSSSVVFPESQLNEMMSECFSRLKSRKRLSVAKFLDSDCLDFEAMKGIVMEFFPNGQTMMFKPEVNDVAIEVVGSVEHFRSVLSEIPDAEEQESDDAIAEHAKSELVETLKRTL